MADTTALRGCPSVLNPGAGCPPVTRPPGRASAGDFSTSGGRGKNKIDVPLKKPSFRPSRKTAPLIGTVSLLHCPRRYATHWKWNSMHALSPSGHQGFTIGRFSCRISNSLSSIWRARPSRTRSGPRGVHHGTARPRNRRHCRRTERRAGSIQARSDSPVHGATVSGKRTGYRGPVRANLR